MRLLLIEDNARLAGFIAKGIKDAGFTVDTLGTAEECLAAFDTTRYDAAVLDLMLPDGDGLDVLRKVRARGITTPVLVLTAREGLEDRVKGLNSGADDYLAKPFAMAELVARLRALLRRPGGALGARLQLGNLTFDTIDRAVDIAGHPVILSRRELDLLELLLRRAGRVVSRNVLEEGLYGFGEEIESNSLEAHVSRLRKKLGQAGASIEIHTVRGVGYIAAEINAS
jgi:DNA-binding response OmpR family regulator